MTLETFGWSEFFAARFAPYAGRGLVPGRISAQHKDLYFAYTGDGELRAEMSGQFRFQAGERGEFPAVGDWVALSVRPEEGAATIHAVLPRQSRFSRRAAGEKTEEQVIASNVDIVFLVSGLDGDFNPRRIERYLTMAWESGAEPVIVLNKADLCADTGARLREAERVAPGVPVLLTSAVADDAWSALRAWIAPGRTAAFLGSSGVGKSSLINRLLGVERQAVRDVRAGDDHGRHTTSCRSLIPLSGGGLLMDVPGMRELQLWTAGDGFHSAFEDVQSLAASCRFRDCSHQGEPGCAVSSAVERGALAGDRLESYHKLRRELRHLEI
ncbi:MAG: ribosome small subunit-dependent GTPase A, partial [Candidatus Solibacter usitatus]|nr:ribosome small subunit-dependent GTPase A [Candidatus Solibacter usitatus]